MAGNTSFEACGAMGIARCPLVATQIFDNLVGRKYWNFVSTLSKTGAISHKFKREFDPGSESTLAARLTHASRTRKREQSRKYSGVRVSNTWIICPGVGNNAGKPALIPHIPERGKQQCARGGVRGRLASW